MREGLIPVILGTAVTTAGLAMRGIDMKHHRRMSDRDVKVAIGAGILGVGLAHIALGVIDLCQDRRDR
ncbi:MAG: asparagine synthase [Clostridiales bacterium]|nr:asparagine synthase [Eubacteriales bacterium]MDH7567240.1 asparagine synthase [Clostridiales bacterium]